MNEHDDQVIPQNPFAPYGLEQRFSNNTPGSLHQDNGLSQNLGTPPPNDQLGNSVGSLQEKATFPPPYSESILPDFHEQISIPSDANELKSIDPTASKGFHSENLHKDYFDNEDNNHDFSDNSHVEGSISHQNQGIDHDLNKQRDESTSAHFSYDSQRHPDAPKPRGRGGQKRMKAPYSKNKKVKIKKGKRPKRTNKNRSYTCANCGDYTLERFCFLCRLRISSRQGLCFHCMQPQENGECTNENCRMSPGSGCPECGEEQCNCIR